MEGRYLVPTCEELPDGVYAISAGETPETFFLKLGYVRTSNTSLDILECPHKEKCEGGRDVSHYCATGYHGPYES